ncbi:MAG: ATP-dependent sacrificial sulfur transferase LarE [Candidatus Limivicinus sp.]
MTLKDFFKANPKAALAFSGGTDSAYLLWAAVRTGAQVQPYFIRSVFQPRFELADAQRLCSQLGLRLQVLDCDVLARPEIAANPPERCYYCKRALFTRLLAAAAEEGYPLVIDGTNASDPEDDRPGMRALRELGVRSPLREAGLSKAEVRRLSAQAGLFTADKPSYACLATRIPSGTAITPAMLETVETAEGLLAGLGYRNFRVRLRHWGALLQFDADQLARAEQNADMLRSLLGSTFQELRIDPVPRKRVTDE